MTMLVKKAAEILKVSEPRVHQFIAEGRLHAEKLNPLLLMLDPVEVRRLARTRRPTGRPRKNFRKKQILPLQKS